MKSSRSCSLGCVGMGVGWLMGGMWDSYIAATSIAGFDSLVILCVISRFMFLFTNSLQSIQSSFNTPSSFCATIITPGKKRPGLNTPWFTYLLLSLSFLLIVNTDERKNLWQSCQRFLTLLDSFYENVPKNGIKAQDFSKFERNTFSNRRLNGIIAINQKQCEWF